MRTLLHPRQHSPLPEIPQFRWTDPGGTGLHPMSPHQTSPHNNRPQKNLGCPAVWRKYNPRPRPRHWSRN